MNNIVFWFAFSIVGMIILFASRPSLWRAYMFEELHMKIVYFFIMFLSGPFFFFGATLYAGNWKHFKK